MCNYSSHPSVKSIINPNFKCELKLIVHILHKHSYNI